MGSFESNFACVSGKLLTVQTIIKKKWDALQKRQSTKGVAVVFESIFKYDYLYFSVLKVTM